MKLLTDVKQVEDKKDARDPESCHADEDAPLAARDGPPICTSTENTYEKDDVENQTGHLENAWYASDITWIEPEVGLHLGFRHSGRGSGLAARMIFHLGKKGRQRRP